MDYSSDSPESSNSPDSPDWSNWSARCPGNRGSGLLPLDESNQVVGATRLLEAISSTLKRQFAATDASLDGIAIMDEAFQITYVNQAYAETLGYGDPQQLVAIPWWSLHQNGEGDFELILKRLRESGSWRGEVTCHPKEGDCVDLEISLTKLEDGGMIAICRDVTQRKRAQTALRLAKEDADAANRAKSEFLAMMSHEIRTPMTAILGFADMLLGEQGIQKAPAERVEAFRIIRNNGEHLLAIVNDVLDLSKIEAGKLEVEQTDYSPVEVVREVERLMRPRAEGENLSLEIKFDGPLPVTAYGDPTRLRQILVNLVGNGVKFTEVGGVRIDVRFLPGEEPRLEFEIHDTGIGISPEQLGHLFQPFSQADSATTRKYGGTGLGLAICKRLAERLGGDISVESKLGKGATFKVWLPTGAVGETCLVEPCDQPIPATPDAEKVKLNCRVLLAEDGPDNQRLISFLLRKAGAEVEVAENGRQAVEMALAAELGRRYDDPKMQFDVILMDMSMPVMDGYEATRRLRETGYTGPIIALTAHAMASHRQQCLEAGCDDYSTKPIQKDGLLSLVARYNRD